MNKVILVGNGAREHAIAEALTKNNEVELYAFMNRINPGIKQLSKKYFIGDLSDNDNIVGFANSVAADFAIIGPEDPLSQGIVDALEAARVKCASPTKEMSKIEWSKAYTREIMKSNRINGCPEFHVFSHKDNLEDILKEVRKILKDRNNKIAVKPDYLTGGKGVKVWGDHFKTKEEVLNYVKEVLTKGNKTVIIEEQLIKPDKLKNSEFTLQTFVSGKEIVAMPLVQDFKRAYDGDKGPNTGSMGSYSCADHSLPFLSKSNYQYAIDIMKKTASALGEYKGVLYGQFMLTDNGVKLIEFNSRFGDPEALNVLPLLSSDFIQCCEEMIDGNLRSKSWQNKATVCVYLTPKAYPSDPKEGNLIQVNGKEISDKGGRIYYASVEEASKGVITTKSRSIGVLGIGDNVPDARVNAYSYVNSISGSFHYRQDIAEGVR